MIETPLQTLQDHSDYLVLKRVPNQIPSQNSTNDKHFIATIIDTETMGLNPLAHEIIELGMLSFSFSTQDGILAVVDTYNQLNDPGKPIPSEITQITGITQDDVAGQFIDWNRVGEILMKSDLIICHNSGFDRNFLELQTPDVISQRIKSLPFACTIKDIDWKARGIESSKLDYINFKLGFFYDGHRALNDCWATLNPLIVCDGAFEELKKNVRQKEVLLCAINASFEKKDLLAGRRYKWSDGRAHLPKCWWVCLPEAQLTEEKAWLDEHIYGKDGASALIPQSQITARTRYSHRAHSLEHS